MLGLAILIPTLPLASLTSPPLPTLSVSVEASPKIVLPVVVRLPVTETLPYSVGSEVIC